MSDVCITEAPVRGGVGNPRGLTDARVGPGLAPGRDSLAAARARGVGSLPRVAPNPGTHRLRQSLTTARYCINGIQCTNSAHPF